MNLVPVDDKIQQIVQLAEQYEYVLAIEVQNDEDYNQGAEILSKLKTALNKVEDRRKEYTKPLHDEKTAIDKKFKFAAEPFEKFKDHLSAVMSAYHAKKQAEARQAFEAEQKRKQEEAQQLEAELKRLEDEAKAAKTEEDKQRIAEQQKQVEQTVIAPVEKVEVPAATVRTEAGKITMKRSLDFEIYDEQLLLTTHPELFSPDPKKIKEFVKLTGQPQELDGLRIVEKFSPSL